MSAENVIVGVVQCSYFTVMENQYYDAGAKLAIYDFQWLMSKLTYRTMSTMVMFQIFIQLSNRFAAFPWDLFHAVGRCKLDISTIRLTAAF